jgi:YesN/AraC family two-component response regulator
MFALVRKNVKKSSNGACEDARHTARQYQLNKIGVHLPLSVLFLMFSLNFFSHNFYHSQAFFRLFCYIFTQTALDTMPRTRRLLATTAMSSIEISFECGFGSERSFHRQFKLITGKTPLEYRAQFACKISDPGTVKYGPAN